MTESWGGCVQNGGKVVRFEGGVTGSERLLPGCVPALMPGVIAGRVHEAEGLGRRVFALLQVARMSGPLVWVLPAHVPELPMLWGLPRGVAERLHIVRARGEVEVLWAVEEALRSPEVGAVVAEPDKALSLTAGRRLQLAAEAGASLGIMLIRQGMGCNATETRWHCAPVPVPVPVLGQGGTDSTWHHWTLNKNKRGTLGDWLVEWDGTEVSVHMVSKDGKRPRAAP